MHQAIELTGKGRYISLHALQSFADVLLNRGMNGEQKTIMYGDSMRTRVSSQSWNRQIRRYMREALNDPSLTAMSTSYLPQEVAAELRRAGRFNGNEPEGYAGALFQAIGVKLRQEDADKNGLQKSKNKVYKFDRTSVSLSVPQDTAARLAELIVNDEDVRTDLSTGCAALIDYANALSTAVTEGSKAPGQPSDAQFKVSRKTIEKIISSLSPGDNAEIALFGRFVAELRDVVVESSVSTPDAITIGRLQTTRDDFTLVDDIAVRDGNTASGYLDSVSFTPGTFYRHAYIDRKMLRKNLEESISDQSQVDAAMDIAVNAFIEAFYLASPVSRRSRSGNNTVPYYYLVEETNHPVNGISAFYNAIDYRVVTQEDTIDALKNYLSGAAIFPSQQTISASEVTNLSSSTGDIIMSFGEDN